MRNRQYQAALAAAQHSPSAIMERALDAIDCAPTLAAARYLAAQALAIASPHRPELAKRVAQRTEEAKAGVS